MFENTVDWAISIQDPKDNITISMGKVQRLFRKEVDTIASCIEKQDTIEIFRFYPNLT